MLNQRCCLATKRKLFHILNARARREQQEREDREREMLEERSRDPNYDWYTGQSKPKIKDDE
jgi:hypothetical protein